MIKCPLCNKEFDYIEDLEQHLSNYHFLSMGEYYEMALTNKDLGLSLTYLTFSEGYYVPDWNSLTRRYEITQATKSVRQQLRDYYGRLVGDHYFQLFIIDQIYFSTTFPHSYEEFKNILGLLKRRDRNKIWFLDWLPGYPRIISKENLNGLRLLEIDSQYKVKSESKEIIVNDYKIRYPDIIPFDRAHHSRYNILNPSIDCRKTKRLRLRDHGKCVKFFSNDEEDPTDVKSIFRVYKDGKWIKNMKEIPPQDFIVLKLVLLRNKSFIRLIFDILSEVGEFVGKLSDLVFLRNTITVDPGNELKASIIWTPEEKRKKFINISIL